MCDILFRINAGWNDIPMSQKSALALLFASSLLSGCDSLDGKNDWISSEYSTMQEAVDAGALRNGWIPSDMPASAHSIVEVHSVDSNEIWLKFQYEGQGIERLRDKCTEDPEVALPDAKRTRLNVPWWPQGLSPGDEALSGEFVFFSCHGVKHAESLLSSGMALDQSEGLVYYWIAM